MQAGTASTPPQCARESDSSSRPTCRSPPNDYLGTDPNGSRLSANVHEAGSSERWRLWSLHGTCALSSKGLYRWYMVVCVQPILSWNWPWRPCLLIPRPLSRTSVKNMLQHWGPCSRYSWHNCLAKKNPGPDTPKIPKTSENILKQNSQVASFPARRSRALPLPHWPPQSQDPSAAAGSAHHSVESALSARARRASRKAAEGPRRPGSVRRRSGATGPGRQGWKVVVVTLLTL